MQGGRVAVSTSTSGTNDNAQLAVEQRIAELGDLAMNNDPDSLNIILSELENPNREIRKGALEAAVQFGDRSAIPRMQEIAARTEDPAERADILAEIDYLKLPSLTEYLAARRASTPAAGQENSRPAFTNRFMGGIRFREQAPQPLPGNQ